MFSDFINSGYWVPAYEAQNEALDRYKEEYGVERDWRPGMMKMIEEAKEKARQ